MDRNLDLVFVICFENANNNFRLVKKNPFHVTFRNKCSFHNTFDHQNENQYSLDIRRSDFKFLIMFFSNVYWNHIFVHYTLNEIWINLHEIFSVAIYPFVPKVNHETTNHKQKAPIQYGSLINPLKLRMRNLKHWHEENKIHPHISIDTLKTLNKVD